ncbi:hypothetical protein BJ322DRAFT_1170204 [Thelephora terrestris]|uniref:Uncharacterized protein n=1 Tax=Thelephora terrestris TaxID=56493 RepID=A0A9P6LBF0_9AGAM|nr:hypothetical protein BJ322DRAFT_1170204 [Thelephora terrestris]
MSSALDLLIQAGHDITSIKYYALATGTILFYDHLLTLADERSGFSSSYFPMTFQFWLLAGSYFVSPLAFEVSLNQDFIKVLLLTTSLRSGNRCDKTSWYSIFMFVVCTLLAQIVLTVRVYAVTKKNIPIAIGFAIITLSQLVLGIVLVVFAARAGAQTIPPIPLDAYRLCVFVRHRTLEVVYTGISLLYDLLAFSLTIMLARRSMTSGLRIPTILNVIAEDATRYFLVIFTSHFVLEMTLNLGRESIQLLPASGNVVFLPVMISRIMLSLKKAADSQRNDWSLGEPSASGAGLSAMKFSRPRRGLGRMDSDEIPLGTYPES